MKRIFAALLLLAPTLANAAICEQIEGLTYCTTPASCPPGTSHWQPATLLCVPATSQPAPGQPDPPSSPPATCTITVEWPSANPPGVYFYPMTPGCDLDGLRRALANAVARLLGPPPY